MSSYKEIKMLYQVTIILFYFTVWEVVLNVFGVTNSISSITYILAIFSVFLMSYLLEKNAKKLISFLVPIVLSWIILYIYYLDFYQLFNSIFVIYSIGMLYKNNDAFLDYEVYNYAVKKDIVILLGVDTFVAFNHYASFIKYDESGVLKLSILFLVLAVVLLRSGRDFSNNIINNKTRVFNITVAVTAFLLSIRFVGEKVASVIKLLFLGIGYLFDFIFGLITKYILWPIMRYILVPLFHYLGSMFMKIFGKETHKLYPKVDGSQKIAKDNTVGMFSNTVIPQSVKILILIAIITIVLYMVYTKAIKNKGYKKTLDAEVVEEREKIKKEVASHNKKLSLFNKLKNMFGFNDNRDKVLAVYKSFEKDTEKKGIYKKYMTATHLKNITSVYIGSKEELKDITSVYNEAKFSNHTIGTHKVKAIEEEYGKVKKEIN